MTVSTRRDFESCAVRIERSWKGKGRRDLWAGPPLRPNFGITINAEPFNDIARVLNQMNRAIALDKPTSVGAISSA